MIAAHLPALQVVVPLIAGPLCVIVRRGAAAWALATAVAFVCVVIAAFLLAEVTTSGPISYALGGWIAPWGIEYRVDSANAYVLLIVSAIALAVMPYARRSAGREIPAEQHHLFYTALMLCLTGLLGITITGDAFNVFVFLEISSLSSYVLISLGRDRRALTAAFQYLIMGTIGATFFLIGIGVLYMMTGTLNMADLAERIRPINQSLPVLVAFAFIVIGIGLKLALFPLHLWLPNAYAYAPSTVTVFLASTATKVAVYVLLRFVFTVFGPLYAFGGTALPHVLMALALIAILSASVVAVFQADVKRLLAYSSLAQIGYIVLGIALANLTGLTSAILHLFNHALMKGALFMAMGCVYYRLKSVNMEAMTGIGRAMPWTMGAFVLGGLSLIGVPFTVGFMSKWYLVLAALEQGWWFVAAIVLVGSLISVVYVWRVVEAAYFQDPPEGAQLAEAPLGMLIPMWALVVANIYFGIHTDLSVGIARHAAATLMRLAP